MVFGIINGYEPRDVCDFYPAPIGPGGRRAGRPAAGSTAWDYAAQRACRVPHTALPSSLLDLIACMPWHHFSPAPAGGKTVHTVVGVGGPDKNGLTMDILCRMSELHSMCSAACGMTTCCRSKAVKRPLRIGEPASALGHVEGSSPYLLCYPAAMPCTCSVWMLTGAPCSPSLFPPDCRGPAPVPDSESHPGRARADGSGPRGCPRSPAVHHQRNAALGWHRQPHLPPLGPLPCRRHQLHCLAVLDSLWPGQGPPHKPGGLEGRRARHHGADGAPGV